MSRRPQVVAVTGNIGAGKSSLVAWLEGQLGSIETGKFADLIVLERDFLTVPDEEPTWRTSTATWSGGRSIRRGSF